MGVGFMNLLNREGNCPPFDRKSFSSSLCSHFLNPRKRNFGIIRQ
jgi:hypothetical protein